MELNEMTGCEFRTWAEIDPGAARKNMERMHAVLRPGTKMAAVVKTDGYGHGAVQIARALEDLPYLWGFCTATFEEAEELRRAGIAKPILILGYVFPSCYETLIREGIRPAVFREDMLEQLSAAAVAAHRTARIFLAVDTGMSRIGVTPDENGIAFLQNALSLPGIEAEGCFTHFARADEADKTSTRRQCSLFASFLANAERQTGYRFPIRTASNSAGILDMPELQLDMVRAGITLYGLWPSAEVSRSAVPLTPALSWYSTVVYLKTLPAGREISYGGTYTTTGQTRVATISVGYGDGYPRQLSGRGAYVLIRGRRAEILGRICMDQLMVDVTDIPDVCEGDRVTLVGRDGTECISLEQLGNLCGRFNYEIACDINKRVPRVYQESRIDAEQTG